MMRLAITAHGRVQGVGLRPFVDRAARAHGLTGWVRNDADAVRIEAQGDRSALDAFVSALRHEAPTPAAIERLDVVAIPPGAGHRFEILASEASGVPCATIPADLALCDECEIEVLAPKERRHLHAFTNCTACGPRFSIVESLPYDRARTSMRGFSMCAACAAEYGDARDRRYHAEAIACPACGPVLALLDGDGKEIASGAAALDGAVVSLRGGEIVAILGIGGFQLMADALDEAAVARLRARKRRPRKPFAVMFPDLARLRAHAYVAAEEADALRSPAAPIVLLRAARGALAASVAPGNRWIGALLPYSPLHRLLLAGAARPVVCTSGNLADEPLAFEPEEALARLAGIADRWLVHDRRVLRPLDDSIVRVEGPRMRVLRRARGLAPETLRLSKPGATVLALGAHLKATVTLARGDLALVGPHVGDLTTLPGANALERSARDLMRFFDARIERIACDLHPDYASSRLAERLAAELDVPVVRIQHHHAHVAACMAEHGIDGPVIGLAWDGAGLGADGQIWGGEALRCDGARFERAAHLRPFRLPGGERAMRSPRRVALALAVDAVGRDAALAYGERWFAESPRTASSLVAMIERGVQSPTTTSVGRLFDAIACVAGLASETTFEAEAAIALEQAAGCWLESGEIAEPWPLVWTATRPAVLDTRPLVRAALADHDAGVPAQGIAARLHQTLAHAAERIARRVGLARVVLTGGCFQNRVLLELSRSRLGAAGFAVFVPERFPPNDGGISLGQAWVAREIERVPRGAR